MIRIFHRDGSAEDTDAPLVAIKDLSGGAAMLLLAADDGTITVLTSDDENFNALCKSIGMEPSIIKHT